MKRLEIFQVDAFTDKLFKGNPAAVIPLKEWLADSILQSVAAENNLAETAFFIEQQGQYEIRWFTPTTEVDLCGHATLASAYIIKNFIHPETQEINFVSKHSGFLKVSISKANLYTLDFPVDQISKCSAPDFLIEALGKTPVEIWKGKTDYLIIFDKESDVKTLSPDLPLLKRVNARGIIVASHGETYDFVSRFFAPASGINEDPVTGSAHTTLVPYWSKHLSKNELFAKQLSNRSGELWCEMKGNRVLIAGNAVLYLKGEIYI